MIETKTIGFIGGGQMCEAIFSGALESGVVSPNDITIADINTERLAYLKNKYGVNIAENKKENEAAINLAKKCDILLLAIKPQFARPLLAAIQGKNRKEQLIVSIMGGVSLSFLHEFFPKNPVFRVMPNTPMLVRKGIAAVSSNSLVCEKQQILVKELFNLVGETYFLDEKLMDAQTSVGGCSPAFAYLFIEALADGGVEKGLPRDMALKMAAQALAGAAEMVLQTGKHPAQLKDSVTSPGGGTIAGVHALETAGFRAAIMDAVVESCDRMIEVGKKA